METQLKALESRIARREKDFASAVKEQKAAARVERNRLQSLHEQVPMLDAGDDVLLFC